MTDEFLDFVGRRMSRPYFAFLNYFDAHNPYDPPPEVMTGFGSE